jgi:hypothetical protein
MWGRKLQKRRAAVGALNAHRHRTSSGQVDEGTDEWVVFVSCRQRCCPAACLFQFAAIEATATLCLCSAPPDELPSHSIVLRWTCDETSLSTVARLPLLLAAAIV